MTLAIWVGMSPAKSMPSCSLEALELLLGVRVAHLGALEPVDLATEPLVLDAQVVVAGHAVPGVAERRGDPVAPPHAPGRTHRPRRSRSARERDDATGVERDEGHGEQCQHQQDVASTSSAATRLGEWTHDQSMQLSRGDPRRARPRAPRTPRATGPNRARRRRAGRGAIPIGMPVSWARRSGSPLSRAPPPASTMPCSMMSAASSGGVLSRVTFTASTMVDTGSSMASRISSVDVTIVLGRPVTRSRPRISACSSSSSGQAEPRSILTSSARALAEGEAVLLLDELDDRVVELVAADADRLAGDDAAERDDGDLGGAAADVDDHVAGRLLHRQTGTDGRRHRLLDDVGRLAGAGVLGGLLHGALLDAGDAGRHADDHAGLRASGAGAPSG